MNMLRKTNPMRGAALSWRQGLPFRATDRHQRPVLWVSGTECPGFLVAGTSFQIPLSGTSVVVLVVELECLDVQDQGDKIVAPLPKKWL